MTHFFHKKSRRHAASPSVTLNLNKSRTSRPWDGRSSRKLPWFTFLAFESPVDLKSVRKNLTLGGSLN
jgi:hypothetical protein